MKTKDIRNGLKAQLACGDLTNESWPNVNVNSGVRPRLEFSVPSAEQYGGTLKGDEVHREEGTALIVVVTELGQGEDQGADFADDVAALFVEGSRISISNGTITITSRPSIRGGFPDDEGYRIPIAVRYVALAS